MDEREAPLLSLREGEFTDTGPINNEPEVEASLFTVCEKNMFRMEDSYFAFKLIRPQLNDNENSKLKSSLGFSKEKR